HLESRLAATWDHGGATRNEPDDSHHDNRGDDTHERDAVELEDRATKEQRVGVEVLNGRRMKSGGRKEPLEEVLRRTFGIAVVDSRQRGGGQVQHSHLSLGWAAGRTHTWRPCLCGTGRKPNL